MTFASCVKRLRAALHYTAANDNDSALIRTNFQSSCMQERLHQHLVTGIEYYMSYWKFYGHIAYCLISMYIQSNIQSNNRIDGTIFQILGPDSHTDLTYFPPHCYFRPNLKNFGSLTNVKI